MGIILFKDERVRYDGFDNGRHKFEGLLDDTITLTREAKLHLVNTQVTLLCKPSGEVEPTYQTKRNLTNQQIRDVLSSRGFDVSLVNEV